MSQFVDNYKSKFRDENGMKVYKNSENIKKSITSLPSDTDKYFYENNKQNILWHWSWKTENKPWYLRWDLSY